jgi:hypothetical protein
MDAETDVMIEGARGGHAVDVLVRSARAGIAQMWVVECKLWRRRVGKLHVAALAEIVSDVGADRGILISDSGFQAGAIRVARDRNISLTDITDLRENAADEILELGLRECRSTILRMRERIDAVIDYENYGKDLFEWGHGSPRYSEVTNVWMPLQYAEMALDAGELGKWPVLLTPASTAHEGFRATNRSELLVGLRALIELGEPRLQTLETVVQAEASTKGIGWPPPRRYT